MSWNNVLPGWLVMELCRTCLKKVEDRNAYPGVDCEKCGGTCKRLEDDDEAS